MAFAAVTILMDTLHQHFLQPTPRFPLRNKTKVRLLYKHLSSLQTCLEQDFKVGECDEALKALEAQMRDVSIELRFQIEQELRLFYLGKSMKLRLHSAKKLLPILSRAKEDIESIYRDLNEDDIETMDLESFVLRMLESLDFNEHRGTAYFGVEFARKYVTLPVSKKFRLRWAQEVFHTLNGVVKGGDLKYVMEMLWKHFTLPVSGMPPHINKRIKSFCAHYVLLFRYKEESEDEKESEDEEETYKKEESDDEQGSQIEQEEESDDEQGSQIEQEEESDDEQGNQNEQKESKDEQGSQNEQEEEESDDECETEVIQPILSEAESIIRKELRAPSYLNKYMKQRIQARHKIHQIFMQGIKLTSYIKKEVLKVKNAYYNQSNTLQGNNTNSASLRGPEGENITVGDSLQHTTMEMFLRGLLLADEDYKAANAFAFSELMGQVHLRILRSYSALKLNTLPLFMLWNLQRLDFGDNYSQNEPLNIWGLPQLKKIITHRGNIRLVPRRSVHHNLESIAFLDYRSCTEELFMRIPNLRILGVEGFNINLTRKVFNWFGSLACLYKLEYLIVRGINLYKFSTIHSRGTLSIENVLPNLKILKLLDTYLNWESLYIVGMLPKLEVLILARNATFGKKWKPKDGGFQGLKLLSLYECDLQSWKATSGHFPVLECLVLRHMSSLKKIPSDFADIATLKSIKLHNCLKSVISSAKCIQEEQREYGNNDFSVDILRSDEFLDDYYD
nr:putative disease resistance RPP13-like protein 3 [Ipomoea batatas]